MYGNIQKDPDLQGVADSLLVTEEPVIGRSRPGLVSFHKKRTANYRGLNLMNEDISTTLRGDILGLLRRITEENKQMQL